MNNSTQRAPDPVYGTILVPLDGSHLADGAIPTAHVLAARFGATVHAVSVAAFGSRAAPHHGEATRALGADPDDPRIHVEVDTDVAGAVQAPRLRASTPVWSACRHHGRGRVAGTLIGSTARDMHRRGRQPAVITGPFVVHPDPEHETAIPPLRVDHLVACVDGTPASEHGLPVAAAWAHALGMKLTVVTVAEPCPPRPASAPPGDATTDPTRTPTNTFVISANSGHSTRRAWRPASSTTPSASPPACTTTSPGHPTGLVAVISHGRDQVRHTMVFGSGVADIVHASTAPVLVRSRAGGGDMTPWTPVC